MTVIVDLEKWYFTSYCKHWRSYWFRHLYATGFVQTLLQGNIYLRNDVKIIILT